MQGVSVQTNCISSSSTTGAGLVPYPNLASQDTTCGNALLAIVDNVSPAYDLSTKLTLVTHAHDGLAYVKQLQTDAGSTSTGTIGALHTHLVT